MKNEATSAQDLSLEQLCLYVHAAYKADRTKLDGAIFALLAKKLVAHEVQPGGPYKDESGNVTTALNKVINALFTQMNTPLPRVAAFLSGIKNNQDDVKVTIARTTDTSTASLDIAYKNARKIFEQTGEPLRTQALGFLYRVARADTTKEIANIAAFTAEALDVPIKKDLLITLGEANIYGWIAYMIYDHIIDGESTTALLPVANVAMRLSLNTYKSATSAQSHLNLIIDRLFDDLDEANAWELNNCRFSIKRGVAQLYDLPNYEKNDILARRSGIHILGPLIVAGESSLGGDKSKMRHLNTGLRHYLIARQLSDDIHDWKEDLAAGHMSAVVTLLLAQCGGTQKRLRLKNLTNTLQHNFLQSSMQDVCASIVWHTHQSKHSLRLAGCKNGSLIGLVERLERMAEQSLSERTRFLEFREAYSRIHQ